MRLAFPSLGQVEPNGTADLLALYQLRLHEKKATALLEVNQDGTRRLIMLYAHGTLAGTYRDEADACQPVSAAEATSIWNDGTKPLRTVVLPDMAGRLAWLACESTRRASVRGSDLTVWNQQLHAWKQEGANGLVEITSDAAHGFFHLQRGETVPAESAVVYRDGSSSSAFEPQAPETKWEASLLDMNHTSTAYQCLTLRRAARNWSRAVFESYQNIAGEKFLLVIVRELQAQIRPWQWNIHITAKGIHDEHFFAGADATAHAYRALFMGMGAQMGFAIGGYLAQRILTEMFEELTREERAQLEAHRLIPAAFSE